MVELAVVAACGAELLHDASSRAANPACATRCMAHHLHESLTEQGTSGETVYMWKQRRTRAK